METHEYRIKCQACGLHYAVYSWDENWAGGPEEGRQGGSCPECGVKGGKFVWTAKSDRPIYEAVPGIIGTREVEGQLVGEPPPLMITALAKTGPFGYGQRGRGTPRGPYGTNEGDKWLAPASLMQHRLDADGDGKVLVHEMLRKDGVVQEVVYVTDNAEMISEARQGHELWVEAQSVRN